MTAAPTMLAHAQEYLAFRRAVGFTLGTPGQEVLLFARWGVERASARCAHSPRGRPGSSGPRPALPGAAWR